jgi:hypothetical protein
LFLSLGFFRERERERERRRRRKEGEVMGERRVV